MLLPAMPAVVLLKEKHVLAPTTRTGNAHRPSPSNEVFAAINRIGEVENGFL